MKSISTVLFLVILISCDKSTKPEVKKIHELDWLIGTWENSTKEGNLSENWTKINDSTFNGQTYFIRGNDTLHNETFVVKQNDAEIFYIPTIKGENDDKPVTFKLTQSTEKQFTFENPTHDYPTKIVYSQINIDSIVVEISGVVDGVFSAEKYPMKKAK